MITCKKGIKQGIEKGRRGQRWSGRFLDEDAWAEIWIMTLGQACGNPREHVPEGSSYWVALACLMAGEKAGRLSREQRWGSGWWGVRRDKRCRPLRICDKWYGFCSKAIGRGLRIVSRRMTWSNLVLWKVPGCCAWWTRVGKRGSWRGYQSRAEGGGVD